MASPRTDATGTPTPIPSTGQIPPIGGQGLELFGGEWDVLTEDGQPLA